MAHRLAFLSERQAPPPGIPPQVAFDGVEANRQLILGVSIFSIILGTLPVVGRFLSRKNNKLPFLTDDYLIVVALVCDVSDTLFLQDTDRSARSLQMLTLHAIYGVRASF